MRYIAKDDEVQGAYNVFQLPRPNDKNNELKTTDLSTLYGRAHVKEAQSLPLQTPFKTAHTARSYVNCSLFYCIYITALRLKHPFMNTLRTLPFHFYSSYFFLIPIYECWSLVTSPHLTSTHPPILHRQPHTTYTTTPGHVNQIEHTPLYMPPSAPCLRYIANVAWSCGVLCHVAVQWARSQPLKERLQSTSAEATYELAILKQLKIALMWDVRERRRELQQEGKK